MLLHHPYFQNTNEYELEELMALLLKNERTQGMHFFFCGLQQALTTAVAHG